MLTLKSYSLQRDPYTYIAYMLKALAAVPSDAGVSADNVAILCPYVRHSINLEELKLTTSSSRMAKTKMSAIHGPTVYLLEEVQHQVPLSGSLLTGRLVIMLNILHLSRRFLRMMFLTRWFSISTIRNCC